MDDTGAEGRQYHTAQIPKIPRNVYHSGHRAKLLQQVGMTLLLGAVIGVAGWFLGLGYGHLVHEPGTFFAWVFGGGFAAVVVAISGLSIMLEHRGGR
ncbi:MAG TPA: hypothetical protein VLF67_02540 [Candidatus Saccharimonas sp.]|nr:hypothetical protein [Candidatus Saccharimonas sp.]